MENLVDYSDDDERSENDNSNEKVFESILPIKNDEERKYDAKSIKEKLNKFKKANLTSVEHFDETFLMKLESETDTYLDKQTQLIKPVEGKCHQSEDVINFSKPEYSKQIQTLTLDSDFLDLNKDDLNGSNVKLLQPDQVNCNLLKEDEISEIPAEDLARNGLLSIKEQRELRKRQEIGNSGVITAKRICMDDVVSITDSEKAIQESTSITQAELSQFRSHAKDTGQCDKNAARQHQITWLAEKARQREFELMNSIAASNDARAERMNKYGF